MIWWPFSRKKSIGEAGILSGLTDWHSHILPGVDDGVGHPDESREILAVYARMGVKRLWFTPHVMEDMPNLPQELRQKFAGLFDIDSDALGQSLTQSLKFVWNKDGRDAEGEEIEINLAAENMLDNLFDDRIEGRAVLPIGRDKDHLLVETSYFTPPSDFIEKLQRTFAAGFYPILAHPERYVYMDKKYYKKLLDMGVKFQLNLFSLTGMYGTPASKKARELLSAGCYTLIGSDTHRLKQLTKAINIPALSSSDISALEKLKANNYV